MTGSGALQEQDGCGRFVAYLAMTVLTLFEVPALQQPYPDCAVLTSVVPAVMRATKRIAAGQGSHSPDSLAWHMPGTCLAHARQDVTEAGFTCSPLHTGHPLINDICWVLSWLLTQAGAGAVLNKTKPAQTHLVPPQHQTKAAQTESVMSCTQTKACSYRAGAVLHQPGPEPPCPRSWHCPAQIPPWLTQRAGAAMNQLNTRAPCPHMAGAAPCRAPDVQLHGMPLRSEAH